MLIRAATEHDASAIAQVHIASWRAAYVGIIPNNILDGLDVGQRTMQWASNLSGHSIATIVADSDGSIVGFVSFAVTRDEEEDPRKVAEIQAIYVDPSTWGKGIGQRLCRSVLAELSAQTYEQTMLWVLRENQRACKFYELAGFRLDGKTKVETIGVPLEVVRYCKSLGRAT